MLECQESNETQRETLEDSAMPATISVPTISVKDAAKTLGVSYAAVARWCHAGAMSYTKIGNTYRFRAEDLTDFLDRNYCKAGDEKE